MKSFYNEIQFSIVMQYIVGVRRDFKKTVVKISVYVLSMWKVQDSGTA